MIQKSEPTILTILGVTGDLAAKKILPALFNLHHKKALGEKTAIVGFGRKPLDTEAFRTYVEGVVLKRLPEADKQSLSAFSKLLTYVQGDFDNPASYEKLAQYLEKVEQEWKENSTYLFYLSVPPAIYKPILNNIHDSRLYKQTEIGRTRFLVEKPIGNDAASASVLEQLLTSHFKEHEIYRIDHYLAKEMVQNILTFRFANSIFEKSWNSDSIEKIEIRLWETLGVENRGGFYDSLGALRDVGQNHLLQMLALIAMDPPMNFDSNTLHLKRAMLLYKLRAISENDISSATYRAQYQGYKTIEGVESNSQTETYFKIRAFIDDARWQNVPIIFESGKRMHEQRKEIIVTYKHPVPCFCEGKDHQKNTITFSLEPTEGITIQFWSKKPGLAIEREQRTMDFMLRNNSSEKAQYVEEYEKLLLDSIHGDQTLFVSAAEVKAMWAFTDPIVNAWKENSTPLESYKPDTNEAVVDSQAVD